MEKRCPVQPPPHNMDVSPYVHIMVLGVPLLTDRTNTKPH